jgi:hypothetical protein
MSEAKGSKIDDAKNNILKSRDDHDPTCLYPVGDDQFQLAEGSECSWVKPGETFRIDKLRQRIEPWLTALFQSEHLSMLIGSGLTRAIHGMVESTSLPWMAQVAFNAFQSNIEDAAQLSAKNAGRDTANIEDQIRVANELLVGLGHYCPLTAEFDGSEELKKDIIRLEQDIAATLDALAASILDAERRIVQASEREVAFGYLVSFLMSPASRSGTRDRLQIFTTNYDRLIEAGAEVAGLHLIDRFVGSLAPVFRSSRLSIDMHYNPPGIRGEPRYLEGVVRFTKLHGSVDWVNAGRDIRRIGLPFGADSIDPFFDSPGFEGVGPLSLMVYPNSAKDRETTAYPYVDLFRDFAAAICRPNNTLVTYGYSFGDEHINRVIDDMLTIPSTHLVIISYGDPMGRIMKTLQRVSRQAQTTLLIGDHLGDLRVLVDHYLPKPAIDRTTFRMAELLRSRFGKEQTQRAEDEESSGGEGDGS